MKTVQVKVVSVNEVKSEISASVGKEIRICEYKKQRKVGELFGKITGAYDNVFSVQIEIKNCKLNKSFSYVDFSIGESSYEILN